jgi:hypothetical protein
VNTIEIYETKDLLNDLNIEISEFQEISDGDINYFIFSSSNLEEEQKEILLQLDFEEIKDNLFISERDTYNPNEILEVIKPLFSKKEEELWSDAIKEIHKINEKYLYTHSACLFNLSYDHILIPLKWHGKLTTEEIELRDFIDDLNKLIRQSCKKRNRFIIDEKYTRLDFWEIVSSLRNRGSHISTERGISGATDLIRKEREAYERLINKEAPDSNLPFDFINTQIKLLEYCHEFLSNIIEDL